jgi:hypothetical protein
LAIVLPNLRHLLTLLLAFLCALSAAGQARTTTQAGDWNNTATWGGLSVPDNQTFGVITILHEVHVPEDYLPFGSTLRVNQVTVGNGGLLVIDPGDTPGQILIDNGTGTDFQITGTGQLDVYGLFIVETGSSAVTTNLNTQFFDGSYYETRSTAIGGIVAAVWDAGSTVLVSGLTTNGTAASSWNQALSNVVFDCPGMGGKVVNMAGFLRNMGGDLSITDTGTTGALVLNSTGTSTGANQINIGGDLIVEGPSSFMVTSTGTVDVAITGNFTFQPVGAAQSSLSSTGLVNIYAVNAAINSGSLEFASGANGTGAFNISGDFTVYPGAPAGTITQTGGGTANANIRFSTVSAGDDCQLTLSPTAYGTVRIINLSTNTPSGELLFLSDATFHGVTQTAGDTNLGGFTLTINANLTQSGGASMVASGSSGLVIASTGTLPADVSIANGSTFGTVTMNRASTTFNTSSSFTATTFNLFDGAFTHSSAITIADGGLVERRNGTVGTAFTAAGSYDVTYNVTSPTNVGPELLLTGTRHFTKLGASSVTFPSSTSYAFSGNLIVTAGTLTGATSLGVTVAGDFVANATANFGFSGSTFTFSGSSHAMSGSVAPTFQSFTTGGALSVSVGSRVNGNYVVNGGGSVTTSAGVTTFGGTTAITNGGSIQFGEVTLTGTLTAPSNEISISGNFNGTGAFTDNGGTVRFTGSTSIAQAKTFTNVIVNPGASLSPQMNVSILGSVTNNGTISMTAATLTWNSSGSLSGTPTATTFNNLTVATGRSLAIPMTGNISILGSLTVSGTGTLNHSTTDVINVAGTMTGAGSLTTTGTLEMSGATGSLVGAGARNLRNFRASGTVTGTANLTMTGTGTFNVTGSINMSGGTTTFSGSHSITGSGSIALASVTVSASQTLTSSTGTLSLNGGFTNNGTFNHNSGTIAFTNAGATVRTISLAGATTFNNISIANNGSATDVRNNGPGALTLSNYLTVSAGAVFDADGTGGGTFIVPSPNDNPGQDGAIGPLTGGASVTGNVTVQRYWSAKDDANRYLSVPVSNATVASLQDDMIVTGQFPQTAYPCTGCQNNGPSLKWYREDLAGALSNGWLSAPTPGGNNTEALVPGRAYVNYMWNGVAATNIDYVGTINQGSVVLPVSYTNNGVPAADGWSAVGNPYPAPIIWDNSAGWTKSNVDATIYIWNVSTGGWLSAHESGSPSSIPGNRIASSQVFWILASAGAAVTVNETAKASSIGGNFYRERGNQQRELKIGLTYDGSTDHCWLVAHNERGTGGYDPGLDGIKLIMGIEKVSVGILGGDRILVSNFVKGQYPDKMPLTITGEGAGMYELSFEADAGFEDFVLVDNKTGAVHKIHGSTPYRFQADLDEMGRTDRFYLTREGSEVAGQTDAIVLKCYPNPVSDILTVEVEGVGGQAQLVGTVGQIVSDIELVHDGNVMTGEISMTGLAPGVYFVRVTNEKGVAVQKVLKY